jgi:uncharacterized protein (TIGR00369 family)
MALFVILSGWLGDNWRNREAGCDAVPNDDHYRKLERLYASAPINEYFKPTMQVSDGSAEIVIPIQQKFHHAAHAVHGSVYFKALDDAAFFAANSVVEDVFVLTVSFNIYLIRPISHGELKAIGQLTHRSRRLFIAEARLIDQSDREIARGSGSFMKSNIPLTPDVGYQ